MKYYIAIPTYNGGELWQQVVDNLRKNAPENLLVQVIDSSSKDNTPQIAEEAGFDLLTIAGHDFNHGGTRNLAVERVNNQYDVVIFLTQDAIPQPGFIENIVSVFNDDRVACAYGRQLPHDNANPLATHARMFNYPSKGYVCSAEDIPEMGLKTVFMSNSFSAYRLSIFNSLGGFPSDTILCEDMYFTAKAILNGYRVAYVANAIVKHSHNYNAIEEFKRYFDIGVFHKDEAWIRNKIGGAGGEGKKFILSEFSFLLKKAPLWIPIACINNLMKIIGYKIGLQYTRLPKNLIKSLSMHKRYWG
ncbi:glycosyltransferase family 2 protein [Klebsiella aerogenes]|uniref:N-glycosyltransferase n=3 Tax=Klebsiella aerogenes TaxID=548 RepID=A0A346NT82_KLEAE|nr:glycosyltransferase family A protein [Klebsiella aerogenes]AEG99600.1 putative rhamnosyl transferase [Klebsiella aerogenes KCTC 2190]AXR70475.1 N-glycosyltransferase [Klebsiella aerogenes]EIX9028785.1 glycosyltransferase family 2 protein [Klebsiella aerogenes]EIX9083661.1 glycosyltransferase family 2 protein [Klebsiella aerogenes]EKJ9783674.1 glycosyltransferase family 2 protein [Klebsiella aerogenes]